VKIGFPDKNTTFWILDLFPPSVEDVGDISLLGLLQISNFFATLPAE
jgi:hypothetical protein